MSPRTPESLAEILVKDVARLDRAVRGLQNKSDLGRSSIEDSGAIPVYTSTGDPRASFGVQFDGSAGAFELTGPAPAQTTAPICTGGSTIVVRWDGFYAGDPTIVSPMNFLRVEIHASQDPNFDAKTAATLRDSFESPRGGEKTISLVEGVWYIKLVARATNGKPAPASEGTAVTVTPILTQAELNALEDRFDADMLALVEAQDDLVDELDLAEGRIFAAENSIVSAFGQLGTRGAVYPQPDPPAPDPNGLWLDTNDGNKAHRFRQYVGDVLRDRPRGFWLLNETSGDRFSDSSGNNLHATRPPLASPVTGPYQDGRPATTDSGITQVIMPEHTGSTTIEMWFHQSGKSVESYETFLERWVSGIGWRVQRNATSSALYLRVDTSGGANQSSGITTISSTGWVHMVWVINADTQTIITYRDGVEVSQRAYLHGNGFTTGTYPTRIIQGNEARSGVAIYERALSPESVAAHYAAAVNPEQWVETSDTRVAAALTAAGRTTAVFYDTATPPATNANGKVGDTWRQQVSATDKDIKAEWFWDGDSWEPQKVTSDAISNLDVGKLSAGAAVIADLVAQKIAAASGQYIQLDVKQLNVTDTALIKTGVAESFFTKFFATNRLSAQHIYVGPGANPIPDPAFMDPTTTAARIARSTGPTSAWTEVAGTTTRPKGIRRTTPSGGALFDLWPSATATAADIPNMVPVEEGQTWKLEVEVETSLTTGVYFMMRIARGDGSLSTVQVTPTSGTVLNGRRTIVGEYVVPAGVVAMTPAVSTAASGTIFTVYGNAYMGQKTDGTLIVDNLLLGKTIIGTRLATADTGARIEMNGLGSNNRLFGVNTSGVTYMDFNENGAFLKGVIEVDAPLFAQKIRLGPILIPTSTTTSTEAAGLAFFKALEPAYEKPPMITSYDGSTLVLEGRNNLTSLPGKIFIGENLDIQMHGNVFIQGNFSVPIVEASELRNAVGTLPTVIARTYDAGAGVIRPGIWLSRDGSAGGDEAFIGVNADDNIIIDPPTGKNILQLGRIRLGWSTANSIIVAPSLAAFYFRNDGTSGDEKSADGAIWTPTNTNNMFVRAPSYGGSRGAFRVDTGTFLEYYDPPTSTFGANLGIASNPKDRIFKLTSNPKFKLAIEPQTLEKAKLLLKVIPVNWFDRFQAEAYAAYMTGEENVSLDDIPPLRRIPGLNAQNVLDAGLDEFVTYNHEGELEGVYYDRLWTLLIILVQHMWDQMETMQEDIQKLKKKAKF